MKRIWPALCILAACAVGAAVWFYKVRSDVTYGFDFGSVVDALVILFIGVLVEYAYLKQSSDKRADTDLLLGIVEETKGAFRKLIEQAELCESGKVLTKPQQIDLSCAERELSNAVHSIQAGLEQCKVSLDKIGFEKLKSARSELKDSLTDTPFPGPYDHASRIRIRSATRAMRDELTRIAFAINHR